MSNHQVSYKILTGEIQGRASSSESWRGFDGLLKSRQFLYFSFEKNNFICFYVFFVFITTTFSTTAMSSSEAVRFVILLQVALQPLSHARCRSRSSAAPCARAWGLQETEKSSVYAVREMHPRHGRDWKGRSVYFVMFSLLRWSLTNSCCIQELKSSEMSDMKLVKRIGCGQNCCSPISLPLSLAPG